MARWTGKMRDLRGWWADSWSDFVESVDEVCRHNSFPQVFAVLVIVGIFCLGVIGLWAILSVLLALPVWGLWNTVMPSLGVPAINYWQAYCLTLLCAILFRGNSIHLKGDDDSRN